ASRQRFETTWGLQPGTLDDRPGLTVVEVMNAIKAGTVRGMYIMGENPAMSDPDASHARESLAALDPPGDARQDLWIVQQIGKRLGLPWRDDPVALVFDEMRKTMPSIAGITWDRLEREHAVTYPCVHEGDPGDPVVFTEDFPREG